MDSKGSFKVFDSLSTTLFVDLSCRMIKANKRLELSSKKFADLRALVRCDIKATLSTLAESTVDESKL